jgi:hypothetical protein
MDFLQSPEMEVLEPQLQYLPQVLLLVILLELFFILVISLLSGNMRFLVEVLSDLQVNQVRRHWEIMVWLLMHLFMDHWEYLYR